MHVTEGSELILLNIGYSELNANWNWKSIYSPFARIYYVTEGEARTYINDKVYTLQPGFLYLTPPFTLHDDECDSCFSLYYIHFYEKTINKETIFDRYDFPIGISGDDLGLSLTKRLHSINPDRHLRHFDPQMYDNFPTFSQYIADNNKMPLHSVVETQGILYQLLARFLEQAQIKSGNRNERVSKCLRYIHENVDKDVSISQLAGVACISEDHLIRLFKKDMQCTPLRYINLKKIEKAQLLLLTTDISVRDIAFDLSIDNISYFNRLFKQHTGKTPTEYRKEFGQ